jgi:hypothetical protein
MTCIPITWQRLGKHILARANAHHSRTPIARQRRGKHTSSTIQTVFSVWSVLRSYKRTQKTRRNTEQCREVKSWVSECQPAGIWAWNWTESSLRSWQLQNNGKKGVRLWKVDSMCDLEWQWDCYKSVARIRLLNTEKPSECVVPSGVCKVSITPISQSKTRLISLAIDLNRNNSNNKG